MSEPTSFGRPHRHLRRTDSTNERARVLVERGAASGTVVTAAVQDAGRGRHGRRWSAPAGAALLYSAILCPLDARHRLLPLAVPLAVCDAIESLAPVSCRVKWPNDVWICEPGAAQGEAEAGSDDSGRKAKPGVPGRKAAGVLIEARPPEWAVIGVGINLSVADDEFPAELRWPATSVGHGATPPAARAALDAALGRWVEADPDDVVGEFERRDALRGRTVNWEGAGAPGSGTGQALGVDEDGNLLVRGVDGDDHTLGAGEVSLRL